MKHVVQSLGIALLILVAGCSSTSSESFVRAGYNFTQINNIAVIDVVGAIQNESAKAQIADEFSKQLLQKGYAPVQRDYIQNITLDTKRRKVCGSTYPVSTFFCYDLEERRSVREHYIGSMPHRLGLDDSGRARPLLAGRAP